MRISDWSSDVCSSDLDLRLWKKANYDPDFEAFQRLVDGSYSLCMADLAWVKLKLRVNAENSKNGLVVDRRDAARQSVVEGKSVSVRGDIGGRRVIAKKQHKRDR